MQIHSVQYSCPHCENDLENNVPGKPFWACPFCERNWTTQELEEHYDNERPIRGNYAGWRQVYEAEKRRGLDQPGGGSSGGRARQKDTKMSLPDLLKLLAPWDDPMDESPTVKWETLPSEPREEKCYRLMPSLKDWLQEHARAQGMPMAQLARAILGTAIVAEAA